MSPITPPVPADSALEIDRLVAHLLSGLEWEATVFHVGQYCGRHWQASTAGHGLASFHLVLHGSCVLHQPGRTAVTLSAGDSVFLLQDRPHHLTACSAGADTAPQPQAPLHPARPDGTGLVCGFLRFGGALSDLLVRALPDCLVMRGTESPAAIRALTELILLETQEPAADAASPVLGRLASLLFFYVARQAVRRGDMQAGMWALLRRRSLVPLVGRLLDEPGRRWTAADMAGLANMSRARLFREFNEACGQTPGQFLTMLRVHLAAQRIGRGESLARAAEHAGYQSYAAFSRAFKKILGAQPGSWQKRCHPDGAIHPPH